MTRVEAGDHFDLVIAGGRVIDGTGSSARTTDVGIREGRIAAIGDLGAVEGTDRIDATGRIVAPGFVDIHSHSDFSLLVDPTADSALAQGVTTEIVGNCGHGCAPLPPDANDDARFTANIYGWGGDIRPLAWTTIGGYLDTLGDARPAINVATLVPYGNLRLLAVKDVTRPAEPNELRAMERLLKIALDDGAVGLSTGLEYPAEHAAGRAEIDALCGILARRDRLYATHTRDRGLGVVAGTVEGIATARTTRARTQVSHILARRGSGAPEANDTIAALLEEARADGVDLGWDVHTRLFGITNLSTALGSGLAALPPEKVTAALRDGHQRLLVGPTDDTVIASFGRAGWDRTFVLDAGARWADLATTSVAGSAALTGFAPEDVLRNVLLDAADAGDIHGPLAFATTYDETDIATAVRTSRCMVGSDATTMGLDSPLRDRGLPGAFTWAAWFLRRLVREWHALPLEEAIRRITILPADQVGLRDRGRIAVGARADLVVFDPATIREPSDPIRPATLATGVDHVLVNGVRAWSDGRPTTKRAGEVIRA
jgi:N-acyl-D-aspartate/D-glutamate deacylase